MGRLLATCPFSCTGKGTSHGLYTGKYTGNLYPFYPVNVEHASKLIASAISLPAPPEPVIHAWDHPLDPNLAYACTTTVLTHIPDVVAEATHDVNGKHIPIVLCATAYQRKEITTWYTKNKNQGARPEIETEAKTKVRTSLLC
jgi:hypothetical protein